MLKITKRCIILFLVFYGQLLLAALPVTNGLVTHLDASTITGIADGGSVSTWADLSGLGYDATQGTSSKRPTYVASNPAYKGLATVSFDGIDDTLAMGISSTGHIPADSTVFIVGNYDVANSSTFASMMNVSSATRYKFYLDGGYWRWIAGNSYYNGICTSSIDTNIHIYGLVADYSTAVTPYVTGFLDGDEVNTTTNLGSGHTDPLGNLWLGSAGTSSFLTGDVAEVIIYNRPLTSTEIADVTAYLGAKYLYSPPSIPTGLVAESADTVIWLNWDNDSNAASFNVKRADNSGGPYTTIATVVPSAAYTDNAVTNGTTYYYVVSSVNGLGVESGDSEEVLATPQIVAAPKRYMENLNRGVVAVRKSSTEAFISWRLLGLDPSDIAFNLYRSGNNGVTWTKVNGSSPLTGGCNYTDSGANLSVNITYRVCPVVDGVEQPADGQWTVPANAEVAPLFRVPLQPPENRRAEKVWVGDLDGDGAYEFVICWTGTISGQTQKLQAYKMDGTFLWEMDFGPNSIDSDNIYVTSATISAGQWDGVTVYDLDSDGLAEVIVKSANGVTFGDGTTLNYGDDLTQFISILDGFTGAEKARIELPNPWKDAIGRPLGTLFGIGYPDGQRPSLMIHAKNRNPSLSFNTINSAWDFRDGVLSNRWNIQWDGAVAPEAGHQIRVVDVDGDGRDELSLGVHVVDNNGALLYDLGDAEIGHGDRFQIGDLDPSRPGQELYMVQQNNSSGLHEFFADAATGQLLWTVSGSIGDIGRGSATDLDPAYPGMECWAFGGIHSADGTLVSTSYPWPNLVVWWDGDLFGDNLNGEILEKWDYETQSTSRLLTIYKYGTTLNSRNICAFQGDIIGDWREEMIFDSDSHNELIIFTTTDATSERIYTLPHNPAYRNCITTQGYRQQHLPDYYLGHGMATPPTPNIRYAGVKFNPADIVQDDRIDLKDFSVLAAQWQDAPDTPSADIAPTGGDGIVNDLDLQVFCENWLLINGE